MRITCLVVLLLISALPARGQDCSNTQIGLNPVAVTRSSAQATAGLLAADRITPLSLTGSPSPTGKVIFLGVGMSNTSNVWNGFREALNESGAAPSTLKWINGAQGGMGAPQWADPTCACWPALMSKVAKGTSAKQVQAIFLMLVTPYPWQTPAVNATRYAQDVEAILLNLETRFVNLQIVYLAGNYYGGYDEGHNKTPEPHGYWENVQLQAIQDTHTGPAWVSASSTMLWADGIRPRAWDGLTLQCPADVTDGGVHLSSIGKTKYGAWLYNALMTDPTTSGWLRP